MYSMNDFIEVFNLWKILSLSRIRGGPDGLMVRALNPGSRGLGSSPGQGPCVLFLDNTLTFVMPLSTQVTTGEFNARGGPARDPPPPPPMNAAAMYQHLIQRRVGRNTPSRFMVQKPG